MDEIWRPIPGYESEYEVSDQGRVRSLERRVRCLRNGVESTRRVPPKILKPAPVPSGHLTVAVRRGNTVGVHMLVARAFFGYPPPNYEVLHRDGVPSNNKLGNLRYGTRSENAIDITRHNRRKVQFSPDEVRYIRSRMASGITGYGLGLELGITPSRAYSIAVGRTYSHVE